VGVERAMERRFKVEAKSFFFSTKASQLRLEERRKGFLGLILVDLRGATWLAATVEEASRSPALEDFVRSSNEGRKSLSVRGGCNKGGRFLEVVVFVDDDRKGIIWIPEARSGRGWRRFVTELRSWLAVLTSVHGFSSEEACNEKKADEGSSGVKIGRSYADVVRSQSGEVKVGPQFRSTQGLDLFPVASSFEVGFDVWEASSARVCFEVETASTPVSAVLFREEHPSLFEMPASSFSTAAAEEKVKLSKEGRFVISWLWKHLGLSGGVLGRIINGLDAGHLDGLQEKPIDGPCEVLSGRTESSWPIPRSGSGPDPEPSEVLCSVWVPASSGPGSVAVSSADDGPGGAVAVSAAGDGFVSEAGDGIFSADGGEVGSVVSVGFDAGGGPTGSDVADSEAGDGITLVAGDEVGPSTPSIASEGSTFAPPDLSVSSDQARWVAETASPECLCSSDTSEEGESSGSAENDLVGDVSESKSFADSAREDSQAWFFGWVRASVQDDEELLAKLDVIEERTRRTKLDALPVEHPLELLQMREKLASMDVERGQALATAWLMVQDEECL
jgi:hypothetical protein